MSMAEAFLRELELQVPVTRKFLERLPQDKLEWQPHPRSMTAGQLAYHLASVPGSVVRAVQQDSFQIPDFRFHQPTSVSEIVAELDRSVEQAREILPGFDDAALHATWRILDGERELVAMPRRQFLRDTMLNHWYQHRGQFCVYLRLLNIPVPASWGPSADEWPNFAGQGAVER